VLARRGARGASCRARRPTQLLRVGDAASRTGFAVTPLGSTAWSCTRAATASHRLCGRPLRRVAGSPRRAARLQRRERAEARWNAVRGTSCLVATSRKGGRRRREGSRLTPHRTLDRAGDRGLDSAPRADVPARGMKRVRALRRSRCVAVPTQRDLTRHPACARHERPARERPRSKYAAQSDGAAWRASDRRTPRAGPAPRPVFSPARADVRDLACRRLDDLAGRRSRRVRRARPSARQRNASRILLRVPRDCTTVPREIASGTHRGRVPDVAGKARNDEWRQRAGARSSPARAAASARRSPSGSAATAPCHRARQQPARRCARRGRAHRRRGRECGGGAFDVTDHDGAAAACERLLEGGAIQIVVNNAGSMTTRCSGNARGAVAAASSTFRCTASSTSPSRSSWR
jgi:hypothetical protein